LARFPAGKEKGKLKLERFRVIEEKGTKEDAGGRTIWKHRIAKIDGGGDTREKEEKMIQVRKNSKKPKPKHTQTKKPKTKNEHPKTPKKNQQKRQKKKGQKNTNPPQTQRKGVIPVRTGRFIFVIMGS